MAERDAEAGRKPVEVVACALGGGVKGCVGHRQREGGVALEMAGREAPGFRRGEAEELDLVGDRLGKAEPRDLPRELQ